MELISLKLFRLRQIIALICPSALPGWNPVVCLNVANIYND